jgi:hypothetical protein
VLAQTDIADSASALGDLSDIFGIELDSAGVVTPSSARPHVKAARKIVRGTATRKTVKKARNKKA